MSRYPSNSSTPSNALFSPAIASSNPAHSSMVFGVQGSSKFLDISPIGQSEVVDTAGPGEVGCLPSKETKEAVGEESLLPTVAVMSSDGGKKEQNRQNLRFPSTPGKDAHLQVSRPNLTIMYVSLFFILIIHVRVSLCAVSAIPVSDLWIGNEPSTSKGI